MYVNGDIRAKNTDIILKGIEEINQNSYNYFPRLLFQLGERMKTVLRYLRPYKLRMAVQITVKLLGTVVELLLPGVLSLILDVYAVNGDIQGVIRSGIFMLLFAVLAWIGNVAANRMATTISRDFILAVRRDLFEKTSDLSAEQRDRFGEASLNSRLTSDTYNVHNMVDRMQRLGIRAPIMLLGGVIVSLTLDPVLTLVLIATLPLLALTIIIGSRKGIPLFTRVQEWQDRMVRKTQENMAGARVIRALSRTDYERKSFARVNEGLADQQTKADTVMASIGPLTGMILNIGLAAVVVVGAVRVSGGLMQPGTIVAFLSYFLIILNAMMSVSRIFIMYSKGSASARRIAEVLNAESGLETGVNRQPRKPGAPHIAFRHVFFSYCHSVPNIFDINFELNHGQTLGVIGPTGSGKSTLLYLILRMYDADRGSIELDGVPVSCCTPEELHSKVGIVFQNDFLITDTIRENIRFGREIADGAIDNAIETAQAGFIRDKDGGLDFRLDVKGHNLSGGQQQRLLVCRALAEDPRLLLLDDCSSALDFRTDRELRHALRARYGKATTVIVAQRVSSVMAADKILVMDSGRIIGYGTHNELLDKCPSYAELCEIQLGGGAA